MLKKIKELLNSPKKQFKKIKKKLRVIFMAKKTKF